MNQKRVTAAEFHAQLENDPAYRERIRLRDARFAEIWAKRAADETPILVEMKAVGVEVAAIHDLIERKEGYAIVYPILAKYIVMELDPMVRGFLGRALSKPDAVEHWDTIVKLFKSVATDSEPQQGFALGLSGMYNHSKRDEYLELIRDSSLGSNRLLLLQAFRRDKSEDTRRLLVELMKDPQFSVELKSWRRKDLARNRGRTT